MFTPNFTVNVSLFGPSLSVICPDFLWYFSSEFFKLFINRTNLQKCSPASETWKILTDHLDRYETIFWILQFTPLVWELNDLYVRILKQFLNEVRQNKAKYSLDRQAIAKRLCTQITKATGAIKQLVKEYTWQNVDTLGCKYLSTIAVEDALSIDSPMWRVLNDDIQPQFAVPYCLKRQLIDLVHMRKRYLEE